jgi:post-segregation antitoxin (ccd killing protein)
MSTRRVTISVPEEVALRMRDAAGDESISAWVTSAIEAKLEDAEAERLWQAFYASVAPSRADVRRGDALFQRLTRPARRRQTA